MWHHGHFMLNVASNVTLTSVSLRSRPADAGIGTVNLLLCSDMGVVTFCRIFVRIDLKSVPSPSSTSPACSLPCANVTVNATFNVTFSLNTAVAPLHDLRSLAVRQVNLQGKLGHLCLCIAHLWLILIVENIRHFANARVFACAM